MTGFTTEVICLFLSDLAYEHYSLNFKKQFKYTPLSRFIIFFIVDNSARVYARSHRGYTCSGITGGIRQQDRSRWDSY